MLACILQETDVNLERCKEIIVVYEPQPDLKKAERMSLIGMYIHRSMVCELYVRLIVFVKLSVQTCRQQESGINQCWRLLERKERVWNSRQYVYHYSRQTTRQCTILCAHYSHLTCKSKLIYHCLLLQVCVLLFAGFRSFLVSQQQHLFNKRHRRVYQDMTQPITNYFINSSHNT